MCEFCEFNYGTASTSIVAECVNSDGYMDHEIRPLFDDKYAYFVRHFDGKGDLIGRSSILIDYCPVCGKLLQDGMKEGGTMYLFIIEQSTWVPGLSTDYAIIASSDDKEKIQQYRLSYMQLEYKEWADDILYDEDSDVYYFDFEPLSTSVDFLIVEVPLI